MENDSFVAATPPARPPIQHLPTWPGNCRRTPRVVVVVDMVDSVRLIERDEDGIVDRWRRFVHDTVREDVGPLGGRLVKSLGDGLMLEFAEPLPAVRAALKMQQRLRSDGIGRPVDLCMQVRVGIHAAPVIVDELDLFGSGVNLAARLSTLAGPGEIVASAEIADHIASGLDADVEDLGECHLKHVAQPVRAFRLGAVGAQPVVAPRAHYLVCLQPVVAVVPLDCRSSDEAVGDLIADGVIAQLSRMKELRVVSRLSSGRLRGRSPGEAGFQALGAHYVLSGSCGVSHERLLVMAEMCDVRSGQVVWAERLTGSLEDLFQPDSELIERIASHACRAILDKELEHARTRPLPTLEAYSLLTGAIMLMHHATASDFERVRPMLEHLIDRHGRHPIPRAWLSRWHVLRVVRGLSPAGAAETQQALDQTRRALDADPDCTLAMAIEGFVHCHMLRDLDAAQARYEQALRINPSESLAWLFLGVLHAFKGEGPPAAAAAERALTLSPLDPLLDYYQSLAATALLASGGYERAIALANASLRANRMHPSTYRALAIAQALGGQMEEARATVHALLRLEPGLTVRDYLRRSPGGRHVSGPIWAEALRAAGVPHGN